MQFQEHNNRKKADKFAEYITGQALRRYVADKVKQYVGENVSVFDGAAGSGQLEQFVRPTSFTAVEVQSESCDVLRHNFPTAQIYNQSFFLYPNGEPCDCVIMNPPFSLKFKDLSQAEQAQIQSEFPWKKSGVVDDIFVLKGLANSHRWGFFILFPGVGYRQTEKRFREEVGNQLVELNRIQNAFEDTPIEVLFLVVDKTKTTDDCSRELIDCAGGQIQQICADKWKIRPDHWESIQPPPSPKEEVKPLELEAFARDGAINRIVSEVRISKMIAEIFEPELQRTFNAFIDDICVAVQAEKIV
ncbi:SAM-dependent methyltransferase [Mannheimia pernigra]|uniref:SAM-dependent methyltransferase n=1 Tax=Mannheimia pernigra TaxID=111844 RepID=UPI001318651E|nr:SAM-dependent methyltransferase [Mannheimia pernigra]QHB17687.1 SAM-dependent methyltransferase [Mannheimia pernigra]